MVLKLTSFIYITALICKYAQINSYYLVFFWEELRKLYQTFYFHHLFVRIREDSVNE